MKSLREHILTLAKNDPQKTALLSCNARGNIVEEISRATLLTKIEEAATYLQNKGLRVGDRVALQFGNCTDLLILSWAAWSNGIVTVPLDTKRDTDELRTYKIKTSGARLLVTQEEFAKRKEAHDTIEINWMSGLSHESLILFTSGTTAHPKGVQLSLQNLVVNAEGIHEWLRIGEDDRFLVELPLHHINSTTFCLASLIAGASIAIPPLYSNSLFFEQAANSGATLTSVVPSIIFDQLNRTKEFEEMKSHLKLNRIQLGSAPVVTGDALEFMQKFSIQLYQGYGQTETALRVTGVPMNLPPETYESLVNENSIGTPMQWADVEITDSDGKILGAEVEGEIIVKGYAVMKGYVGGEPAFRDGWFLTGDIGYWKEIDGKRFFYLVGRSKEIIIKGGVNISPVAVENALKKSDTDIEQVYVVGMSDDRYGEEVGAIIVWRSGIESNSAMRKLMLILLAGSGTLSDYETPKYLTSVQAETLPMTSTGKVQRNVLKKIVTDKFKSVYEVMHNDEYKFRIIHAQSELVEDSCALYNHCWQSLNKSANEYKKYLSDFITLGAIDTGGKLAGQISFSYSDNKLTCVSICSANYKPKEVPEAVATPTVEYVRDYLLAGHDPVMNFHVKLGAVLSEVIPNSRPDDKSALGYTMLLSYPNIDKTEMAGPVANQLIQAVRILANDIGAEVTAISRPGGLASYLNRTT